MSESAQISRESLFITLTNKIWTFILNLLTNWTNLTFLMMILFKNILNTFWFAVPQMLFSMIFDIIHFVLNFHDFSVFFFFLYPRKVAPINYLQYLTISLLYRQFTTTFSAGGGLSHIMECATCQPFDPPILKNIRQIRQYINNSTKRCHMWCNQAKWFKTRRY